jgi:Na+/H+-translocating membrane pyrophosphatase
LDGALKVDDPTAAALKEMIIPGITAVAAPVIQWVGFLPSAAVCWHRSHSEWRVVSADDGQCRRRWDNAKKAIEKGRTRW